MRALAEFTHPALAVTGFAFWAAYLLTGDRVFAAIGLGILLGAICAGVSWFTVNKRAVRRGRADALILSPRLLLLHGAGAALTLLLTALITARG
jgi:NhaP-type Na+/H+ and K+/H+ antiporter